MVRTLQKAFRGLMWFLTPYERQKRVLNDRLRGPATDRIDALLRRVWAWKGARRDLVLDDGWQGAGDEEFRTLLLKPAEGEVFHFRFAPARKAVWFSIRGPEGAIELPSWLDEAWLVNRFFSLEQMLDQLSDDPIVVGLFA